MGDDEAEDWGPGRPGQAPDEGEVVVWRVGLDPPADEVPAARGLLSADELQRADRFFRERDRVAFTVLRAALRVHLGALLGRAPASVRFEHGERGKPRVAGAGGLEFNASGSGSWGLLVFSSGAPVGVDVERHRDIDHAELARNHFAPPEVAELLSLPEAERPLGFFNGWSRKEAFIKALGTGLYFPLGRFVVSLSPSGPARLLSVDGATEGAAGWSMEDLPIGPGYSAAVVRRGPPFAVRLLGGPAPRLGA